MVDSDSEDDVMEALLEADADAEILFSPPAGQISITAAMDQYQVITEALETAHLTIVSSDLTKIAENDSLLMMWRLAVKLKLLTSLKTMKM